MQIDVWCQTDVGLKRDNNQDTFLLDPDLGLYIVADGMGGHLGGEVASSVAAKTLREVVSESWEHDVGVNPREILTRGYRNASVRVWEESQAKPELQGMGTTMVSALIRDQQLYVANVGDSRAYLVNDLGFWQLTEDHSFVNDQIRAGMLKEENARSHAMKNVITRSVGFERDVTPDILIKTLVAGDKLLLCSDGLSGLVEDRRIAEICSNSKLPEIVPNLISEAKANGGDDNVTVLLLSVT
jgi:protein phosphatase